MSRAAGAIGSLLVHLALLLSMLTPPAPPPATVQVHTKRDGAEFSMRLIPSDGDGAGLGCEHTYTGIGIEQSFSGHVREVVAGGPADRAGLRAGDRLLNDDLFFRDRYSVGRAMTLSVERDGVRIDLPVRIGLICYAEVKD